MRIYISSTTLDLKNHRRAVVGALLRSGHTPVCMEHHAAGNVVPKDECLREVSTCEVYVGIFAWRYGFIPPQCEVSLTEMEYREAVRCGIPTLVFLMDENAEWPAEYRDEGVDGRRIAELRNELQLTKWVGFFSTPDSLAIEVLAAMMQRAFIQAQGTTPTNEKSRHDALQSVLKYRDEVDRSRRHKKRERVPNSIPEKPIRFFQDRAAELAKLRQCLSNKNLRMVLICGRGGMGKTALVVKLLHELMDEIQEGSPSQADAIDSIIYVPLGELEFRSPDRIVKLISRTLEPQAAAELN